MQLNDITRSTGRRRAQRVGRGTTRGKTSGRGTKGQKARAGRKIRPMERDTIKRLPKRRGHGKNRSRTVNAGRVRPVGVNLATLEAAFAAGDRVDLKTLVAARLVRTVSGRAPKVKILAQGALTKQLTVADCDVSARAKEVIEKVGGSVL